MDTTTSIEAAGAGGRDAAAAHKAMLETPGLQFDFTAIQQPKPPDWLRDLLRLFEGVAPVFKYIFWGGLAVGAALILFLILREVLRARFGWTRKAKAPPAPVWRPEAAQARRLLEDADQLAAQGRFDEAVHMLLFRSIEDLSGRRPGAVQPALTSRDIAAMEGLPGEARSAFSHIVREVEASFFGGRPVGQAEFGRCREAYERFAFAGSWA